jgi:alanine racemase
MSPRTHGRPTVALIDLEALAFNFRSARDFIGLDVAYMAVVKANAYGHGAVECARKLQEAGVDWFGVATVQEAMELRRSGIGVPILVLGGVWPGEERKALDQNLTPVVFQLKRARALNAAAAARRQRMPVHIKIDTGMGRLGIRFDAVDEFLSGFQRLDHLQVEGLMTHFAAADRLDQTEFTDLQIERFGEVVSKFRSRGIDPRFVDLANSPGAVVHPRARGNMVRLGGILYGLGGDVLPADVPKPELRPVMSIVSEIGLLKTVPKGETIGYGRTFVTERDSLIATVPIGYHDGYPRPLSNIGRVIVRDRLCPVAGRVSMDWITVDVSEIPDIREGEKVLMVGQTEKVRITAEELAACVGTISYEITCGMSGRVPRVYVS